jgi:hypothetical protein
LENRSSVETFRDWNNLHQVRSKLKDWNNLHQVRSKLKDWNNLHQVRSKLKDWIMYYLILKLGIFSPEA